MKDSVLQNQRDIRTVERCLVIPPAPFKGGGALTLQHDSLLCLTSDLGKTKSENLPVE
jgi:hypothetical protein